MTLAKSSALKTANETQPEQRTKLPAVARLTGKGGQGVGQGQVTAFGQESDSIIVAAQAGAQGLVDSAATVARASLAADQTADAASSESMLASGQESSTQPDASILTWQAPNAGPAVDLSAGMESFTILAQAPASVLSDLPAKQAESVAASAQWLSLPTAGVLAVGAVFAGVAGGSSSGNSAESAKKALDDKLDAIQLGLKVDSGLDNKDGVTNNGTLEIKDASGAVLATDPTGLQYSKDGGKTWVSNLSSFAPDSGANSVILRFQGDKDLVSKSSSPLTFTFDNVAPTTPTVGLKSDSGTSATDKITNAVASAADLATSSLETGARLEVSAKADGVFGSTFTPAEGSNTVQIRAVDLAGNASAPSASYTFTFDSKVAVPTIGIAPGSVGGKLNDSGLNSTDGLTNVTNPVLAGTAEPNSKLSIELANGAAAVKVDTSVDTAGKWQVALPAGTVLADGTPQATVSITDLAGNTASSKAAAAFTIDSVAPTTPTVGLKSDSGTSATDKITNAVASAADLTTSVLETGARLEVSAKADGVFGSTFTPAEGANTVQIRAVDLAGNASAPSASFTFTFDSKVAVPTIGIAPGSVGGKLNDSGPSSADGLTNVTNPVLAGTAELNSKLSIELANGAAAVKVDTSVDAAGKWQVALPAGTVLADGTPQATVSITDPAGNTASSKAAAAFTIDTKAPLASQIKAELVHDKTNDDGVSPTDGITSNQSPFLSGTAEAGSTVAVSFAGVTGSTPAVVGADGKWSAQVKLSPGTWTPLINAKDAADNVSDPAPGTPFTIKQAMTAELKHDAINDTGISASDSVTFTTFPTLVGYSLPNASVKIALAGQTYDAKTAADGTWSVDVKSLLADGDYTPTIATVGVAGVSETPINGTKFTVDTKAPDIATLTVALDAASDTGVSNVDGLTSSTAPTISGKAAPGSLVSVRLDGGPVEVPPTTVTVKDAILVGADGKWSTAVKLTAGVWTPSVTVSDVAGNQGGPIEGQSFEIVTQAAISTISLDPGSDTGASFEDGVTSNAQLTLNFSVLTLTGTVDTMRDGTSVLVTLGSVSETVVPDSSGAWTYTPAKALADGEYSAKVVVKDAVGLDSAASVQKIVIDSTAPVLVHQPDLVQTAGVAFNKAPAYGKLATGDEVLFEDVGGQLTGIGFDFKEGTGAVSAPSKWGLTEGSPTFGWVRTTVTDLAGNPSVDEYQVAAVTKTTNYTTSSAQTIDESAAFAPTLYVDKTTDPGLTVTLTATVGSVIQMGAGNDTVKLDGADFFAMNFAALDGGAGTGDALSLNADTTNGLFIDLSAFNRAGDFGDGKVLTHFELLKFNIDVNKDTKTADTSGTLSLSPEDLYRLSSDLIDTVGGSWSTLVVTGNADDTVSLVSIDLSPDDGVDQDFYQVGKAGAFTATGAAGTGYTKVRATVVDPDGSHGVELLIASAVTLDPGSIDLQRAYPVIG
jgi:uncharacterized protein YfaP (DUF2135 family)